MYMELETEHVKKNKLTTVLVHEVFPKRFSGPIPTAQDLYLPAFKLCTEFQSRFRHYLVMWPHDSWATTSFRLGKVCDDMVVWQVGLVHVHITSLSEALLFPYSSVWDQAALLPLTSQAV